MVMGTTAMGGGEVGVACGKGEGWLGAAMGRVWEGDVGIVGGVGSVVGCEEASAPLEVALPRAVKALTSLILLFWSIFESAPRKQIEQKLGTG